MYARSSIFPGSNDSERGVEYYVLGKRSCRDVGRNPLRKLFARAPLRGLTLRDTKVDNVI